jgi:hypothetical protein
LDIESYLTDLKLFFNDILISGVDNMPLSVVKKLKFYSEFSRNYNLFTLSSLIEDFITKENSRSKIFIDISIWLDIAIIEFESISIE